MGSLCTSVNNALCSNGRGFAALAAVVFCITTIAIFAISTQQGYRGLVVSCSNNQARHHYNFSALAKRSNFSEEELQDLFQILSDAVMEDKKTVFVAPLNKAWAAEGTMLDNFLESLHLGDGISYLVDHLVFVALDKAAYERCLALHKHCFELRTEGVDFSAEKLFMTQDYLKMTKRKIYFLGIVLQLGFDFVFTDLDLVWFRPPFQHFSKDADFSLACDAFNGNSSDLNNAPNTGLLHVHSNERTIRLYEFWHQQHDVHPELHDQDVFNNFKHSPEFHELDLKIKFMPTEYFGGFCQVSRDMEKVCTMHANCCGGLDKKLAALKLTLEDWKLFKSMTPQESREHGVHFRPPNEC